EDRGLLVTYLVPGPAGQVSQLAACLLHRTVEGVRLLRRIAWDIGALVHRHVGAVDRPEGSIEAECGTPLRGAAGRPGATAGAGAAGAVGRPGAGAIGRPGAGAIGRPGAGAGRGRPQVAETCLGQRAECVQQLIGAGARGADLDPMALAGVE